MDDLRMKLQDGADAFGPPEIRFEGLQELRRVRARRERATAIVVAATLGVLAVFLVARTIDSSPPTLVPGNEPAVATPSVVPPRGDGVLAIEIMVDGKRHIYSIAPNGSGLRELSEGSNDQSAVFSPDGTKIAYASQRGLVVSDAAGEHPRVIVEGSAHPDSWSLDGRRILVTIFSGDNGDGLFSVPASGGEPVEIPIDAAGSGAAWSPTGELVAYQRVLEDGELRYRLFVANTDGTGERMLIDRDGMRPDWSPDGTKIAFGSEYDVWVVNADGTDPLQLTDVGSGTTATNPLWSPDGRRIAYEVDDSVWIMNADGSDQHRIARGTPTDWGHAPPGPTQQSFDADGVAIDLPPDWTFVPTPVPNLIDPPILFGAGNWQFLTGGDCGPEPSLRALPSDGAFLWITEYSASDLSPEMLETYGPRPAFDFEPGTEVQPECASSEPSYGYSFRDNGRLFEVHVAFGPDATEATMSAARDALESIQAVSGPETDPVATSTLPAPVVAAGPGEDTYVFTNIEVEYPYVAREGAAPDPGSARITFESDWSGSVYPGEADCEVRLRSADGTDVGGLSTGWAHQPPHIDYPPSDPDHPGQIAAVSGVPVGTTWACSAGQKPADDVRVEGPEVVGQGDRTYLRGTLISASGRENIGTQDCKATAQTVESFRTVTFQMDVPANAQLNLIAVNDVDEWTNAEIKVTCKPFTGAS